MSLKLITSNSSLETTASRRNLTVIKIKGHRFKKKRKIEFNHASNYLLSDSFDSFFMFSSNFRINSYMKFTNTIFLLIDKTKDDQAIN